MVLAIAGVFDRVWFWTVLYASLYGRMQSWQFGAWALQYVGSGILSAAPVIWLLALTGSLLVWWKKDNRQAAWFMVGFSIASAATVVPGLHFRHHYFIPMLPAIGLWAGAAVQTVYEAMLRRSNAKIWLGLPMVVLILGAGDMLFRHRALYFVMSPGQVSRALYDASPFPESIEIARYVADHTNPDDRIAVIGSEPQIYFYSRRRSATGYIYTYPLMEPQRYARRMEQQMIKEIETAHPRVLIAVHVPIQPPDSLFAWLDRYAAQDFETVGLVTIKGGEQGVFHWDSSARGIMPDSEAYIRILKRKETF